MWRLISLTLAAAILVTSATAALMARPEDLNQSTGVGAHGILWPDTADEADEGDLIPGTEDELHGGFSSLEGMLQWAIGHSDPAKLKETAKEVRKLSPEELKGRQIELQEFMEKHKLPSDAKLMQIAIDDLKNSSMSLEDRFRALYELLELVEPIDNANGTCNSHHLINIGFHFLLRICNFSCFINSPWENILLISFEFLACYFKSKSM
nr:hsp70 nucleotide exchange factor FES1-like [Ipomoea batatas]